MRPPTRAELICFALLVCSGMARSAQACSAQSVHPVSKYMAVRQPGTISPTWRTRTFACTMNAGTMSVSVAPSPRHPF